MDKIRYDPERILNGFTMVALKELAKKLKSKIRPTNREIIQEILFHLRGKPEKGVKVWQEINRYLRKELEAFSQEASTVVTFGDVPREERFKVGYMFTLSPNSEVRALGEELYCRQAEDQLLEKDKALAIWAMEFDWNRPRRRMSTCQLVLYKQNDEKLTKLDEIRDIARYWNVPCNELLNFSGRTIND